MTQFKFAIISAIAAAFMLGACTVGTSLPAAQLGAEAPSPQYLVGPGDKLEIFVWRNSELSTTIPVRPDGRISVPLIEDLPVTGKTPTAIARDIEKRLSEFIQDPRVTVIVTDFTGPLSRQVRVVGEAAEPKAIPYRANMTLLDVMISVGGLTEFAAGNRASIVRQTEEGQKQFSVRLTDLVKHGDISANVGVLPGDVLIIPESFF